MLTVLQVAYPLAPVGLDAAGGAEQVLAMLDRALETRGHRSLVVACAGSEIRGALLPVTIREPFDETSRRHAKEFVRQQITEALQRWPIDVIHLHGVDFFEYLPQSGVITLATLHLPASYYPDAVFSIQRPATFLNCVSHVQHSTCPSSQILLPPIANGVPLELFPNGGATKEDFVLALGRICPEKGFHLAFDAAQRAGVPLILAGAVFAYAEHEQYFRREIAPRLTGRHQYLGPVNFSGKCELLSRARCLLVPSLVPETSSLVAMEAMACGTPVIAFPSGALAHIVEHGRTGYLVNNVDEMAGAIRQCAELDAREVRRVAHNRFSADHMADRYIDLYQRLVARTPEAASLPNSCTISRTGTLQS